MGNCKFCKAESGKYELCYECYWEKQNGLIDICKCGNYKYSSFYYCDKCEKHNKTTKRKFSDSIIKGRLAEAIIEELFISLGYEVHRYGMENTIPGFMNRFSAKGEVAFKIRRMPDFVVVKDSEPFFIEVKYRSNDNFDFMSAYDKEGGYPYPDAYFILVSSKYIKIQKASKLEKGEDFIYLGDCTDFNTDKDIIKQYVEFTRKFFGNIE